MDNPTTFSPKPGKPSKSKGPKPVGEKEDGGKREPGFTLEQYMLGTLSMESWEPSHNEVIGQLGIG